MTPEIKAIIEKMLAVLTLKEADQLSAYLNEDDFGTTEEYFLEEFEAALIWRIQMEAQELEDQEEAAK